MWKITPIVIQISDLHSIRNAHNSESFSPNFMVIQKIYQFCLHVYETSHNSQQLLMFTWIHNPVLDPNQQHLSQCRTKLETIKAMQYRQDVVKRITHIYAHCCAPWMDL